jgi:hypothetical protein
MSRRDADKARIQNNSFLNKGNEAEYIPVGDYNPATKKYVDDKFRKYNDMQWSVAAGRVPAANTPSFETFTANTKEYGFGLNDYIDLSANELPHGWQEQSMVELHMHPTTKAANATGGDLFAKFEVFLAKANGDLFTSAFVEETFTAELTIPDGTAALTLLYLDMGNIDMTGYYIGTELKPRIRRIAATSGTEYSGNIFITQLGANYLSDESGSATEAMKF